MDHLSGALKRGGIKDLLAFFPPNKREGKSLEEHFKKEGMTQVADWWAKKQYAVVKEGIIKDLTELNEREEPADQARHFEIRQDSFAESKLDNRIYQEQTGRNATA